MEEDEEGEEEEALEDIRAGLQLQPTAYTAATTRQPLCPLVQQQVWVLPFLIRSTVVHVYILALYVCSVYVQCMYR